ADPGVIALVFDRLSPDARALARKAAGAYAEEGLMADDFTGVFGIDMSLLTFQEYTDNRQLVKQAIEQATSRSASTFVSNNEQTRKLADREIALSHSLNASPASTQPSRGTQGPSSMSAGSMFELMFTRAQLRMLETFERLERDQQGHATTNS